MDGRISFSACDLLWCVCGCLFCQVRYDFRVQLHPQHVRHTGAAGRVVDTQVWMDGWMWAAGRQTMQLIICGHGHSFHVCPA